MQGVKCRHPARHACHSHTLVTPMPFASVERDARDLASLADGVGPPVYAKMISDDEFDLADHSVGYLCDGERLELLSCLNDVQVGGTLRNKLPSLVCCRAHILGVLTSCGHAGSAREDRSEDCRVVEGSDSKK